MGADTTLDPPRFIGVEGKDAEGRPRASNRSLSELTGTATSSSFGADDVNSLGGIDEASVDEYWRSCRRAYGNGRREREREGGELELGFDSRKEGTSSFPVLSQPSTDY